jgi:hypothetical protein
MSTFPTHLQICRVFNVCNVLCSYHSKKVHDMFPTVLLHNVGRYLMHQKNPYQSHNNWICNYFVSKSGHHVHAQSPIDDQGGQMSLLKNLPKTWPNPFLVNLTFNFYLGKRQHWATFVFLKKVPKESNRPVGENSPNLVTLCMTRLFAEPLVFGLSTAKFLDVKLYVHSPQQKCNWHYVHAYTKNLTFVGYAKLT